VETPLTDILAAVRRNPSIKLVYFDNKLESVDTRTRRERYDAGYNLAKVFEEELYGKGWTGKVVANSYQTIENSQLLDGVSDYIKNKWRWRAKVILTADGSTGDVGQIIGKQIEKWGYVPWKKTAYVDGISVCMPDHSYDARLRLASSMHDLVIGWTYDGELFHNEAAVRRISLITNFPGQFDTILKKRGTPLCS